MLKDIKDAKEISCYDALTGRYTGEEDGWQKWKDLDEDTSYEVFCLCREFVAKTEKIMLSLVEFSEDLHITLREVKLSILLAKITMKK